MPIQHTTTITDCSIPSEQILSQLGYSYKMHKGRQKIAEDAVKAVEYLQEQGVLDND